MCYSSRVAYPGVVAWDQLESWAYTCFCGAGLQAVVFPGCQRYEGVPGEAESEYSVGFYDTLLGRRSTRVGQTPESVDRSDLAERALLVVAVFVQEFIDRGCVVVVMDLPEDCSKPKYGGRVKSLRRNVWCHSFTNDALRV